MLNIPLWRLQMGLDQGVSFSAFCRRVIYTPGVPAWSVLVMRPQRGIMHWGQMLSGHKPGFQELSIIHSPVQVLQIHICRWPCVQPKNVCMIGLIWPHKCYVLKVTGNCGSFWLGPKFPFPPNTLFSLSLSFSLMAWFSYHFLEIRLSAFSSCHSGFPNGTYLAPHIQLLTFLWILSCSLSHICLLFFVFTVSTLVWASLSHPNWNYSPPPPASLSPVSPHWNLFSTLLPAPNEILLCSEISIGSSIVCIINPLRMVFTFTHVRAQSAFSDFVHSPENLYFTDKWILLLFH